MLRTCAVLTLTCCYLMWVIVYLAQLHPIISEYCCRCRCVVRVALWAAASGRD